MYYYRVTKYNPIFRDKNNAYVKDDWTSISDIGNIFDDKVLTFEIYLYFENAYIDFVKKVMAINNIDTLTVVNKDKHHHYKRFADLHNKFTKYFYKSLKDGMQIDIINIEIAIRFLLREIIWFKLENKYMFVHFGYDYYMYIGSDKQLNDNLSSTLFVEPMISPYMGDDAVNNLESESFEYKNAIQILINSLPELKLIYEQDIDYYDDLPYIFYESVFEKYIMEAVKSNDENKLITIFQFIESLMLYGDDDIKNLVGVAILESLYFEPNFNDINKILSKYYGDLTRKSLDECRS